MTRKLFYCPTEHDQARYRVVREAARLLAEAIKASSIAAAAAAARFPIADDLAAAAFVAKMRYDDYAERHKIEPSEVLELLTEVQP